MIGKVVTGCVAILSYHTATQDRGSECCDFSFISRIVTALLHNNNILHCNPLFFYIWHVCVMLRIPVCVISRVYMRCGPAYRRI